MRRPPALLALTAAGVAAALTLAPLADSSAAATGVPSAPRSVAVAPAVGSLIVSWSPPARRGSGTLHYVVRSSPAGLSCSTTATSCSLPVRDATPWRFAVVAETRAGASPSTGFTFPFRHLTVLVIAGQSNAIGFESYAVDPVTHRHVLNQPSLAQSGQRTLIDWVESGVPDSGPAPVSLDTPQVLAGAPSPIFGPEAGLASAMFAAGHQQLLIVKVAFAGTSLGANWVTTGRLYQRLVATTRAALAWAADGWWSATIGAVYWIQGETDAEHPAMAATYERHLHAFLRSLRGDLGVDATTPVVLARTDVTSYIAYKQRHRACAPATCAAELKGNAEVRAAQQLVATTMPDTYEVDTASLPRFPSVYIHLTNVAELALGRALARVSLRHLT